ncbi:NUDIX domain-containing protein [Streptomyces sp. NPDC058374]|uniref:NUDIX domain-containing protein n=1 Tax=unclassified Streptomyces TaxID=2593676 RepID=UPI0036478E23
MIIWVNGAFGADQTAVAKELTELLPGSVLFDPDTVGEQLVRLLPPKRLAEVADVQELPMWRRLVVDTAAALYGETGGDVIVPGSLLRQEYRDEIFGSLAARRIAVSHVLVDPGETILRARAAATPTGTRTAARHPHDPAAYGAVLAAWLAADAYVLDTRELTPPQSARRIADLLHDGGARACDIVQTPEPTAETVASGVLLFDEHDRVLLVDPTYKPGWEFPGGIVEPGEAPAAAGVREVAEETGLSLQQGALRLLVMDWEPPVPPGFGGLRLLFDGGRLHSREVAGMLLPGPELRGCRFVTLEEAEGLLPPVRFERLRWAVGARGDGGPLYLERGVPLR